MRGICFPADVANDAPSPAASFTNFVHGDAKTVARRHPAPDHWCAIRAHDHTVMRPARGGEIERAGAHVRFQLSGATYMRKAERLGVDRPASNKNGQATSGPAVPVQRGVYVDHQALPQTPLPPVWRVLADASPGISEEPNMMLRACPQLNTRYGVNQPEAALSPSRGSRRRRAVARPWSYPGDRRGERTLPSRQGICPAGSSPTALASPTPLRSP